MSEELHAWLVVPPEHPAVTRLKRRLAALLWRTSRWMALQSLALRVPAPGVATGARTDPVLEFHAEAGAPEGALFVDGRFVGIIDGVNRL